MKKINILLAIFLLSITTVFSQYNENYTIKNLNDCNDELSNFGTAFYGENQMIYASPDRKHKVIKDIWNPNQQPFLDLYIGDIAEDGEIVNGKQLKGEVKTKYHEADVVFTKDLSTVYFTRDNYYESKRYKDEVGMTHLALFKADVVNDGEWTNIIAFPYNSPKFSIGHPALSVDEKTLYFISDMPSSMGKTDVFKVNILGDNSYGLPENLGPSINTPEREMFTYISDKNVLYFSSDGWDGLGELDIYASDLKNNNSEKPTNLGSPINSYSDDFAFLINEKTKTGYLSSNRGGGKGDDDIYYFEQNKDINFDCNQVAKGIVTDKNTGRRIPGALVVLYDNEGTEIASKVVGEDARFSFDIDCSSTYKVEGSKYEYSIDSKEFKSDPNLKLALDLKINKEAATAIVSNSTVPTTVVSAPIYTNTNPYNVPDPYIVVNPNDNTECQKALNNINTIYFDLDKSYIRPDAAEELEMVVLIMRRCENIIVEAGSHTDSRASRAYNRSLSERRAKSTVDFITSRGIGSYRIVPKGYGERQLLNRCSDGVSCSKQEHQINRRTKFKIIN